MKRAPAVLLVVLDAVGVPTLRRWVEGAKCAPQIPNLVKMGLGGLIDLPELVPVTVTTGYAAPVLQASVAADSVVGHGEMVGIIDERHFELFPDGFPAEYIAALEHRLGVRLVGNEFLNGNVAIQKFRDAHEHDADHPVPIYASNCDPVVQLAALEDLVPPERLAEFAKLALEVALEMGIGVTRAISRPYVIEPNGAVRRTGNRRDFTMPITVPTLVDILRERGVLVAGVGKIPDLVRARSGYDLKPHLVAPAPIDPALRYCFVDPRVDTNPYNIEGALNVLDGYNRTSDTHGLFVFLNLVDTDSIWGHAAKDSEALRSLECFDRTLPLLRSRLQRDDLIIITADHGMRIKNGQGYHSREPVPLLVERIGDDSNRGGLRLGDGPGLTQVGGLVAQMFGDSCRSEYLQTITSISPHPPK